MGIEH